MALSKTISQTYQYTQASGSPVAITSITVEPIVYNNVLQVSPHYIQPGVFTTGTVAEGYGNPQQP